MHTVHKRQVKLTRGMLVAEASSLELRPGEWPMHIAVVDNKGEGFLFMRGPSLPDGGFDYFAQRGQQLRVFND